MAAPQQGALPDYMLKMINGELSEQQKQEHYDKGLQRWWKEYAARKNDEEEEHVADSLLYDERCHLPRTTPRPVFQGGQQEQQQEQQREQREQEREQTEAAATAASQAASAGHA